MSDNQYEYDDCIDCGNAAEECVCHLQSYIKELENKLAICVEALKWIDQFLADGDARRECARKALEKVVEK